MTTTSAYLGSLEEASRDHRRMQEPFFTLFHRNTGNATMYRCPKCGDYCSVCRQYHQCCLDDPEKKLVDAYWIKELAAA
jgi:hypothetical protein